MNSYPRHPRLGEKFRALHCRDADSGRGFVCILDLRRDVRKTSSCSAGRFIAGAALLALVIFCADMRVPMKPVPPLHFEADAVNLAEWESPTGFLLAADFLPTPPN